MLPHQIQNPDFDNRIKESDIPTLEIVGSPKTLRKLLQFAMKVVPVLEITLDDILISLGLKDDKYTKEDILKAEIWEKGTEEDKNELLVQFPDTKPEHLEKIAKESNERGKRILGAIPKLGNYLLIDGFDDNDNPLPIMMDVFSIIHMATNQPISKIKNTDTFILAEILLRIVIKPRGAWNESFFLIKIGDLLTRLIPTLSFIKTEN